MSWTAYKEVYGAHIEESNHWLNVHIREKNPQILSLWVSPMKNKNKENQCIKRRKEKRWMKFTGDSWKAWSTTKTQQTQISDDKKSIKTLKETVRIHYKY